jgi:hypothetical protein
MTVAPDDEEKYIERARQAWQRRCERTGTIYDEPGQGSSIESVAGANDRVVLRNVNGVIAVYEVKQNGSIWFEGTEYIPKASNPVLEARARAAHAHAHARA